MKKTDFSKKLLPYGNCTIIPGDNYCSYDVTAKSGVSTGRFASVESCVTLKLYCRATTEKTGIFLRICSFDDKNTENVVYETSLDRINNDYCDVTYSFDAVSLSVYKNAVNFEMFLYADEDTQLQISEFYITEGEQAPEEEKYENIVNVVTDDEGKKSVRVLGIDGEFRYVPLVPRKVLFIGNSLLLGMFNSFGMCSTDCKNDYAYHVSSAILAHNPDCTFKKLHGSGFEHCETDEDSLAWFDTENIYSKAPSKDNFDADTDLIIIQLTDNVNTDKKITTFKKNADYFIKTIKTMCPRARIVWVYGWYNKFNNCHRLFELSKDHCIELVDISDLKCKENEANSGQISTSPEGEEVVVKDTWITHPGNKGMKCIADRIVKVLGLN